jgi:hypothetical protein
MPMVKAMIHSDLPELKSERRFARILKDLDFPSDNQPHVWFVKPPGLKDVDAVIWIPKTGLFIVEMKSWPLSCIQHISHQQFDIDPTCKHSTKKSPWEQVREAEQDLRERLHGDTDTYLTLGRPWLSPIVALYRISRSDIEQRLAGETGSQSEQDFKRHICDSTVFREDMQSSEDLIKRLSYCRSYPFYGKGPQKGPLQVDGSKAVSALEHFLNPHLLATRPTSAYDKERVKQMEEMAVGKLKMVNWELPIFCTGYVGTGKTILGLRAALQSLESTSTQSRKAGMFVCLNKVLAADIRRLIGLSPKFRQLQFDVFDIFDLVKFIAQRCNVLTGFQSSNANHWAETVVSGILARDEQNAWGLLDYWQFIVVDEAQDLEDWAWKLLDRLSDKGDRLFVIDGKNQLLYREKRAEYLDMLCELVQCEDGKPNYLEQRRVFRTTDTTFLISQLFMMSYPSLDDAEERWDKHLRLAYEKAKSSQKSSASLELPGFELPRRGGYAPRLVRLKPTSQEEISLQVTGYLQSGYERTKKYYFEDYPSNVLILVPYRGNPPPDNPYQYDWAEIARTACTNLKLRFIDYTQDELRRRAYAGDEVRICTYHSSRGVEGLHSIVLGFNSLSGAASEIDWRVENLGYIALSRSVFDTDVLYVGNEVSEPLEVEFLRGVIEIVGK